MQKFSSPASDQPSNSKHQIYMERCLKLASLGLGKTAPNPMVGAVLVHNDRIIGEGYHAEYGQAHAEVNCIRSVSEANKNLIPQSTLYVSLEPCAHYGKTPPCADLIIREKIPAVVIGCRDLFPQVDGKGIEKLKAHGVDLIYPVMEQKCLELNKRFVTFYSKKRPFIILKWAQSADGKLGANDEKRTLISNQYSNRLVHKWRTEEAGIMVGSNTVLKDDPQLTNRFWEGKNPVRIVLDGGNRIKSSFNIMDRSVRTMVFNYEKNQVEDNLRYYKIQKNGQVIKDILDILYEEKISSLIVEGGTNLLNLFFESKIWDEARVITNQDLIIGAGQHAPEFRDAVLIKSEELFSDRISYFVNSSK